MRIKKNGFQLLANIFTVYLLGNRIALDFGRVIKYFVMGSIGNLFLMK